MILCQTFLFFFLQFAIQFAVSADHSFMVKLSSLSKTILIFSLKVPKWLFSSAKSLWTKDWTFGLEFQRLWHKENKFWKQEEKKNQTAGKVKNAENTLVRNILGIKKLITESKLFLRL